MEEGNSDKSSLRIVYAGDRDISTWVLKFILEQGIKPQALLTPSDDRASNSNDLINICDFLDKSRILKGDLFRKEEGLKLLKELKPDYIIGIHFPYLVPKEVLDIPKHGFLNLHPAYLPYNRGWHTPSWAIWEGTPYGATLHFMDEGVDTGDIVHQKQIEVLPSDTADSVYKRIKELEFEVFKEAWPSLAAENYERKPQSGEAGTLHKSSELKSIQHIDLDENVKAGDLIKKIRALTTNVLAESAYFIEGGKTYRVQIKIREEKK